jgi:hypothetical protein
MIQIRKFRILNSSLVILACAAVGMACGGDDSGEGNGNAIGDGDGDGDGGTVGDGDGDGDGTGDGDGDGDGTGDGDGDGDGTTVKLDVAAGDGDGDGDAQDYCNFVDILFVIDNSASMGSYQEQLAFAFPTFVDAMWENLPPETDLHVGMTTTSFFTGSCSESTVNCATAQTPQEVLDHYVTPSEGNTGTNGEQGRLFEWQGQHWFEATVGQDPWPLKTWFADAATAAGETGCSYEMMSAAAGYAMHPDNDATNAGFLRDEGAVLVIVFLTDEPDKSPEGADTYYDMVETAKAGCGGADCVIVTGLVNTCIEGVNNELWQFLTLFENQPVVGSIDDPAAYQEVVGGALAEVIDEVCDEIPPAP